MSDELTNMVAAAGRGDEQAFSELHQRYATFVLSQVRKRLPARNEDLAEEVAQEIWQAVHQQIAGYRPELASFTRWLAVIAQRRAITHATRLARQRETFVKQFEAVEHDLRGDPLYQPDARREMEELLDAIRECADRLHGRERSIFVLARFNELSAGQIAELEGISTGRVRGALSDANKRVLDCLREKDVI